MSRFASLSACQKVLRLTCNLTALFFVLSICAGCAVKETRPDSGATVFFPPTPEPPRIQYLMGISDSRDVAPIKEKISLISFKEDKLDKVKVFEKPYGVATGNNRIYIADSVSAEISVIDFDGQTFAHLAGNKGMGKLLKPVNLTLDATGNLFVADTKRQMILKYSPDGRYLGGYGKGFGWKPVDVAVDDTYLYVLDNSVHEVFVLDKSTGELINSFGRSNADAGMNLSIPTSISLGNNFNMFVSNLGNGKVLEFDRDGHVLNSFGKLGDGFGMFGRPRGISVSDDGLVYITDARHQNAQIFDQAGRLLMFFGNPGKEKGSLNLPAGIAVTRENLDYFQKLAAPGFVLDEVIVVVNQAGVPKVSIYGRGKRDDFDYRKYDQETIRLRQEEKKTREKMEQKRREVTGDRQA